MAKDKDGAPKRTRKTKDFFLVIAMDGGTCDECCEEAEIENEAVTKQAVVDGLVVWRYKMKTDVIKHLKRVGAEKIDDTDWMKFECGCKALLIEGHTRETAIETVKRVTLA